MQSITVKKLSDDAESVSVSWTFPRLFYHRCYNDPSLMFWLLLTGSGIATCYSEE